jgi:hypothetical protein
MGLHCNCIALFLSWFFLIAVIADAAAPCEILKVSLRYTQEDAPTDLSGVVS